jgi:hypothetical protein
LISLVSELLERVASIVAVEIVLVAVKVVEVVDSAVVAKSSVHWTKRRLWGVPATAFFFAALGYLILILLLIFLFILRRSLALPVYALRRGIGCRRKCKRKIRITRRGKMMIRRGLLRLNPDCS